MEITPAMRAHRSFRRVPQYRSLAGRDAGPSTVVDPPMVEGEDLIGVYENVPGSSDRRLIITDRALHIQSEAGWLVLPYEEMTNVEVEGGDKFASNLEIRLRDGSMALVPVLGEDEMGKDIYSMLMFLNHVIGDRERRVRASGTGTPSMDLSAPPVPEEHAAR